MMNELDLVKLLNDVKEVLIVLRKKNEELEKDKIELEKQHEQSLKEAYEKGYKEGVKYTDGLIKDKKFPF
jgi:flagellar biosynthesis/type III secretory pathway protein FliH